MAVTIAPFRAEWAPDFARLNRQWIERYFVLEEPDRLVLEDPQGGILDAGGQVFFALRDGVVVGTAAAMPMAQGVFELAKMAVAPEAQGLGIGLLLGQAVIAFARDAGAETVFLLTNSRLAPALRLYAKLGFVPVPLPPDNGYVRADTRMELRLAS